ncbi:MAG TPA: RDD family protein [Mycobacteriales bacterium]|nr:RDD family protein [Mycobacteriales bacterium]
MSEHPSSGPGSVAGIGARIGAFVVDSLLSVAFALVTGFRPGTDYYGLAVGLFFLAVELFFVAAIAQTPGMRAVGVAVVRARDGGRPGFGWIGVRTLLLATVLPALIVDASGRAMHDRAAGTVMVRTR